MLLAGTALITTASAQQNAPAPSAPPAAAQQPPSLGEKASRLLDRVTGAPAEDADVDMRRVLDSLADLNP
jgi:hypothetical protein